MYRKNRDYAHDQFAGLKVKHVMRTRRIQCISSIGLLALLPCTTGFSELFMSVPVNAEHLLLDGAWQRSATGNFQFGHDRRGLYVIYHPFAGGATGNHGMLRRRVNIPEAWRPPCTLYFYGGDDCTSDEKEPPSNGPNGLGLYPGHRFEKILIDDRVTWESDVVDKDGYGNRGLTRVTSF